MGEENRRLRSDTMPMEGRVSLSNFLEVVEGLAEMGYHPRTKSEVIAICIAEVAQFMVDKGMAVPCYEPDVAEQRLTDYGMLKRRHMSNKSRREARAEDTFQLRMAARSTILDQHPGVGVDDLERATEKKYVEIRNASRTNIGKDNVPKIPGGISGDMLGRATNDERGRAINDAWDQMEKSQQATSLSPEEVLRLARESGQLISSKQADEMTSEEFAQKEKAEIEQMRAILGSISKGGSDEEER